MRERERKRNKESTFRLWRQDWGGRGERTRGRSRELGALERAAERLEPAVCDNAEKFWWGDGFPWQLRASNQGRRIGWGGARDGRPTTQKKMKTKTKRKTKGSTRAGCRDSCRTMKRWWRDCLWRGPSGRLLARYRFSLLFLFSFRGDLTREREKKKSEWFKGGRDVERSVVFVLLLYVSGCGVVLALSNGLKKKKRDGGKGGGPVGVG